MNTKKAVKILLGILVGVIIFHGCIVLKLIPYEITWGGRLKNDAEMYVFESISILLNLLLVWVLLLKGKFTRTIMPMKMVNGILWIFLILFALNTVANLFADTNFEKSFAVLTLTLSILIGIVLLKKPNSVD